MANLNVVVHPRRLLLYHLPALTSSPDPCSLEIPRHTRTICSPSTTSPLGPLFAADSSHANFLALACGAVRTLLYRALPSSLLLWLVTRLRPVNAFVSTCSEAYSSPLTLRIVDASLLPTLTQGPRSNSIVHYHLGFEGPSVPARRSEQQFKNHKPAGGLQHQQPGRSAMVLLQR